MDLYFCEALDTSTVVGDEDCACHKNGLDQTFSQEGG